MVATEPGYARLYLNVGKREGLTPEDVGKLFAGAPADAVGRVLVLGTHSYVSVKEEAVDAVIAAAAGQKVGDRDVVIERARK
jgi:hypothetical protein